VSTMENTSDKVLCLRTCPADMIARGKINDVEWSFKWPTRGFVECPDWDPTPTCGHGLHGLLWGDGDWSLLKDEPDSVWMVVEVCVANLVKIDESKVKFRCGNVIFTGVKADAIARVLTGAEAMTEAQKRARDWGEKSGHYSTAASSGDSSTAASSGYASTAASLGYASTAASSGNYSKAASSGYSSKAASSGYASTAASSGDSSTAASSGYASTAASLGYASKAASSGYASKAASSGYASTAASSGDSCIAASIGNNGSAKAGPNGLIIVTYWVDAEKRYRACIGNVGENEICADTWYKVHEGKLIPA